MTSTLLTMRAFPQLTENTILAIKITEANTVRILFDGLVHPLFVGFNSLEHASHTFDQLVTLISVIKVLKGDGVSSTTVDLTDSIELSVGLVASRSQKGPYVIDRLSIEGTRSIIEDGYTRLHAKSIIKVLLKKDRTRCLVIDEIESRFFCNYSSDEAAYSAKRDLTDVLISLQHSDMDVFRQVNDRVNLNIAGERYKVAKDRKLACDRGEAPYLRCEGRNALPGE